MALATVRPPLPWSRNACDLELPQLIDEARHALRMEIDIPMTVARPPVLTSIDGHGERTYQVAEGSQVGLSMSSQLYRRIGHPEGYGNVFPMARALDDLRGWCRGRHLEAASGPWDDHLADVAIGPRLQRPLCARLAWYVIAWRMTPTWAARQERLLASRAMRLLTIALQHTWEQRREWAHVDESGASQVMAEMRRSRRDAKARATAATASPETTCRYCGRLYDPESVEPCPGADDTRMSDGEVAAFAAAYPGVALLCAPATP